jgi:iron complex transport system substrate-binding protein
MLLPKGCNYEWECIAAGHFCMIEFEAALTHTTPFSFEVSNAERLLKQFSELEYKRISSSITEFESIATLYGILTHLLQNEGRRYLPSEKQQRIAPAVEYLAKHYTERIRNEELASLVGLSCVYFRRLFTEMMGTSPIDYLHSLRIKKAKEMLESDYGSVSDIAFSVGYPDIYDFSRSFKKHTGLSPIQYKKKTRT